MPVSRITGRKEPSLCPAKSLGTGRRNSQGETTRPGQDRRAAGPGVLVEPEGNMIGWREPGRGAVHSEDFQRLR